MPDNGTKFNCNISPELPSWINRKYFEKILLKEFANFGKILKFTPVIATPPGENYTSLMIRVQMDIEMKDGFIQQHSYIMKTMLDNDKGGEFFNTLNLFPKEKHMYDHIIPQFEKIFRDNDRIIQFAPKCHYTEETNGRITLVMEDLNTKKYRNINRLKGFDMLHMRRILEKLAEFHAASAVWQERYHMFPEQFQKSYLPANYQKSKSYQARIQSYKTAMSTWGLEDHQKYVDCIPTAEEFVSAAVRCFNTDVNDFKVLNHGDVWSSNIMLHYASNNDVNQVRFVDFQLCKWGSPAQDLWELIICSVESNSRIREFDHLIQIYYTHLVKYLNILKYEKPIPTLRDLHINMLKYGFWGYYTTFTHLVLILLPSDKDASFLKLIQPGEEGDKFRRKAYTNPLYVRAVLDIFPFLYRRGILDFRHTNRP